MAPLVKIFVPQTAAELVSVQELFADYVASLTIDLEFQNYQAEKVGFPHVYKLLLAASVDGEIEAAVAMKQLNLEICEMKRLYCRPECRSLGLGRRLAAALIVKARQMGFRQMYLDTFDDMAAALALYRKLGFAEIPAYYDNPHPGAHFMALTL